MKSTNQDMAHSTFFWGVAKTYKFGIAIMETSWERVSAKKKQRIDKKLDSLTDKIAKKQGHVKLSIKTKAFFLVVRQMMKSGWNEADVSYWKDKGWTGKNARENREFSDTYNCFNYCTNCYDKYCRKRRDTSWDFLISLKVMLKNLS